MKWDNELTFNGDLMDGHVPQIEWALPDVQKIAYTVYVPPVDEGGSPILPVIDLNADGGEMLAEFAGRSCYQSFARANPDTATLQGYLEHIIESKHLSVLEHASVTFYITGVSRSLTHELVRHRHFGYSQLSQRYVDSGDVRFVMPPAYRADTNAAYLHRNRQLYAAGVARQMYDEHVHDDLADGVPRKKAREAARSVLPNMTETIITVTGNYRAWIEYLVKRDNPAADVEIQRLSKLIGAQLAEHAPNTFGPSARALWDTFAQQAENKH